MKVKGYIALNERTMQVLNPEEFKDEEFSYVFPSIEDLQEYVVSQNMTLDEYIIHKVSGKIRGFSAVAEVID